MLLSATKVDVSATLKQAPNSQTTPAMAAAAVNVLRFASGATSFSHPAQAITREDAVTIALSAASSGGYLRPGPMPRRFLRFEDDDDFASSKMRAAAHVALVEGLVSVGRDNRFRPKDQLTYGEAATLVEGIRSTKEAPKGE
jgi:hypothetical protein